MGYTEVGKDQLWPEGVLAISEWSQARLRSSKKKGSLFDPLPRLFKNAESAELKDSDKGCPNNRDKTQ